MEIHQLDIRNGELLYVPALFSPQQAAHYLDILLQTIAWEQKTVKIYGRQMPSPRLTAWYGDPGAAYAYSGIALEPLPWLPVLLEIKKHIEAIAAYTFNSVLANHYRNGADSMGWHSDDEPTLGDRPVIASLSLGSARRFILRHKNDQQLEPVELPLGDGALLIMRHETQKFWKHHVPKSQQCVGARVNLTFRKIVQ
jgi:alkylated DNA repair dioxygenase AlkB